MELAYIALTVGYIYTCLYSARVTELTIRCMLRHSSSSGLRRHLLGHVIWLSFISIISWTFLALQLYTVHYYGRPASTIFVSENFLMFNTVLLAFLLIVTRHFNFEGDQRNPFWIGEKKR